MQRLKPDVDIVKDILEALAKVQPDSSFIQSLYRQYLERGGLSKKQLQGLYAKAGKIPTIPPARLATLEAIILRKHEKHKSPRPALSPLYSKNEETGKKIESLLAKFPQHKRVLFLRSKFYNNEPLTPAELTELDKFYKLLIGD